MYEKIRYTNRIKGNGPLYIWVLVCLLVFALVFGVIGWAVMNTLNFRAFVSDFSNSTTYAYRNHCLTAVTGEGEYPVTEDNLYVIYTRITNAGAGRVSDPPSQPPEAVLHYGDGSYMELWTVELVNPSNSRKYGLFISYVNPDGERYSYDTDQLELGVLPLSEYQNRPNKLK